MHKRPKFLQGSAFLWTQLQDAGHSKGCLYPSWLTLTKLHWEMRPLVLHWIHLLRIELIWFKFQMTYDRNQHEVSPHQTWPQSPWHLPNRHPCFVYLKLTDTVSQQPARNTLIDYSHAKNSWDHILFTSPCFLNNRFCKSFQNNPQ